MMEGILDVSRPALFVKPETAIRHRLSDHPATIVGMGTRAHS
jgi:hypothetical protein